MNAKDLKKTRKILKDSIIIFLRKKPDYVPMFIWRILGRIFFTKDGYESLGFLFGKKTIVKYNGIKYSVKE